MLPPIRYLTILPSGLSNWSTEDWSWGDSELAALELTTRSKDIDVTERSVRVYRIKT